tara:strand:- start:1969 stop:2811 length:843 start_codon:yes stop_codon:yes gene_type:complete
MLHNIHYTKESLTELVSALDDREDVVKFMQSHLSAMRCITSLTEATDFIKLVLVKSIGFYSGYSGLNERDSNAIKVILASLDPILHQVTDATELITFLRALNDSRSNCYTLENCRLSFVKYCDAVITSTTELVDVIGHLQTDDKLDIVKSKYHLMTTSPELIAVLGALRSCEHLEVIKANHHVITTPSELAAVIGSMSSGEKLKVINFKDAHWEMDYRQQCRRAFLTGSVSPGAGNYGFFVPYTSGNRGVTELKKMIFDLAELEPYQSEDGAIKEKVYTI